MGTVTGISSPRPLPAGDVKETACRACGRPDPELIMDFGVTPLADRLVKAEDAGKPDPAAPLELTFCPGCTLLQIANTVPPQVLFGDLYIYLSSVSKKLLDHSRAHALELIESRKLGPQSFVLEIASNDGYMLKNFVEHGIPVLGVEPATEPARLAKQAGVPTLSKFFNHALTSTLAKERGLADVIIANNVLAHVAGLNDFVEGIKAMLKPDGVAVFEFPYVADLIEKGEFDTIYHQHLCYFSVTALAELFRSHGLSLNNVQRIDIHGGSLRITVGKQIAVRDSVTSMLKEEKAAGMDTAAYYLRFADRVKWIKTGLRALLDGIKAKNKRIVGYGAAAKATTLLSYCDIGPDTLDYIVDLNTIKQGRYMPGCHIPIRPVSALYEDKPDYVLILAWNFAEEIMAQQSKFKEAGGKFIVPIPEPSIV